MGKSQDTFSKKEKEKKRRKKKEEKARKKEERQANSEGGSLGAMIAYVDEMGNIVDTPPDLTKKKEVEAEHIELGVPKRIHEEEEAERQGKVVFFHDSKGYGFITDLKSQEKFFYHINNCIDEVEENNLVTFELEKGVKGMNAVNVKKLFNK